jgi:predicted dehydrogenase
MSKLNFGIVGAGTIALRVLRHLVQPDVAERVSLTAICDPVADRAQAAAEKFGIARWFTDEQELLAYDKVDAVTIASPINFHFEQVRRALLAAKHVHCNKTMATSVSEAKELTRLARERTERKDLVAAVADAQLRLGIKAVCGHGFRLLMARFSYFLLYARALLRCS